MPEKTYEIRVFQDVTRTCVVKIQASNYEEAKKKLDSLPQTVFDWSVESYSELFTEQV
jgi:hypothetical protein